MIGHHRSPFLEGLKHPQLGWHTTTMSTSTCFEKTSLLEQQQLICNLSSHITSHFEWGIT